jgi:hypothetical protein
MPGFAAPDYIPAQPTVRGVRGWRAGRQELSITLPAADESAPDEPGAPAAASEVMC